MPCLGHNRHAKLPGYGMAWETVFLFWCFKTAHDLENDSFVRLQI